MSRTSINWTDFTFNAWWGCHKVSPGCANCYAEKWDRRTGGNHWGKDAERRFFGLKHWQQPRIWANAAATKHRIYRVFSNSMSDIFERYQPIRNDPPGDGLVWIRAEHFKLIEDTNDTLIWLLLTKRIENVREMVPRGWLNEWPQNVMIGFTAENHAMFTHRWNIWRRDLLPIPKIRTFISAEPLLSSLTEPNDTLASFYRALLLGGIDWVIAGGESGARARPAPPEWFRGIRDACADAGTPFLFKQWGNYAPFTTTSPTRFVDVPVGDGTHHRMFPGQPKTNGRMLDGVEHHAFPKYWPQNVGIIEESPLRVIQ